MHCTRLYPLCGQSRLHLRMYVASAPILIEPFGGSLHECGKDQYVAVTWCKFWRGHWRGVAFFEISQNTELMRAQINQSRTETAVSYQESTYNSDYMPVLVVKARKGEQFSDEEVLRFEAYFRSYNRNMDNQLWQYDQGFLGENIPRSIKGGARGFIAGSNLGLELWEKQKHSYTDKYVTFVEEAIADRL